VRGGNLNSGLRLPIKPSPNRNTEEIRCKIQAVERIAEDLADELPDTAVDENGQKDRMEFVSAL